MSQKHVKPSCTIFGVLGLEESLVDAVGTFKVEFVTGVDVSDVLIAMSTSDMSYFLF